MVLQCEESIVHVLGEGLAYMVTFVAKQFNYIALNQVKLLFVLQIPFFVFLITNSEII